MSEEQEAINSNNHKDIIMRQFNKLITFGNVEYRGGFYNKHIDKVGNIKEEYVPDTREVFCNAVFIFALTLEPNFDDKVKKYFIEFQNMFKALQKRFIDASPINEEVILGEVFYTDEKMKILLETYKFRKLELHQDLYLELSRLLYRLQYMDIMGDTFG